MPAAANSNDLNEMGVQLMACKHKRIKSVNCVLFCMDCGEQLPEDFLKPKKTAEKPAEEPKTADNPPQEVKPAESGKKPARKKVAK